MPLVSNDEAVPGKLAELLPFRPPRGYTEGVIHPATKNDLHEAVGLAKLVEEKCNTGRPSVPYNRPQPHRPPTTAAGARLPNLPVKRLTPIEMAARREKGLCFNCDAKFVPGHKCSPPQFLCLMVDVAEEEPPDDSVPQAVLDPEDDEGTPVTGGESSPSISFHALTG